MLAVTTSVPPGLFTGSPPAGHESGTLRPARPPRRRALDWRPVEDYTNKYKGEQVDLALFGGEYQEGVLTAYCSIEDVPHIELNGHILVPLQNVASLHCSSRCDAPEPDWPPRGLESRRRRPRRLGPMRRRISANFLKAFLLVAFLVALARGFGWLIGRSRNAGLFAFCALSAAIAVYWLGDRALLGMLDARPFALAEDPLLRSATDGSPPSST